MRVLLVDDEATLRRALRRLLRKEKSLAVTDFASGAEALRCTEEFDVALLDIDMPEMPGPDLAARLREKEPAIVLVFMTGDPRSQRATRAREFQRSVLLEKPVSLPELTEALRFAARESRRPPPPHRG